MDIAVLKTTKKFGEFVCCVKKTTNQDRGGCAAGWSDVFSAPYGPSICKECIWGRLYSRCITLTSNYRVNHCHADDVDRLWYVYEQVPRHHRTSMGPKYVGTSLRMNMHSTLWIFIYFLNHDNSPLPHVNIFCLYHICKIHSIHTRNWRIHNFEAIPGVIACGLFGIVVYIWTMVCGERAGVTCFFVKEAKAGGLLL